MYNLLIMSSANNSTDDTDDGVDNFELYFTPPTTTKTNKVKNKKKPEQGYVKRKWTRRIQIPKKECNNTFQ